MYELAQSAIIYVIEAPISRCIWLNSAAAELVSERKSDRRVVFKGRSKAEAAMRTRVGRRCQICSNTSINVINRALLGGATLSEIARRHGLALGSLHRHRSKCLGLERSGSAELVTWNNSGTSWGGCSGSHG